MSSTHITRALGLVLAAAAAVGLAAGSHVTVAPQPDRHAILRLAWRARPDRVEDCRPQSAEALARVPAHMRQAAVCDGAAAPYHLQVSQNGRVLVDELVHGGGLRRDRPIYVFRELPIAPGEHAIAVRFVRAAETVREQVGSVPAVLSMERSFVFEPGRVVLVTYDPEERRLLAIGRP